MAFNNSNTGVVIMFILGRAPAHHSPAPKRLTPVPPLGLVTQDTHCRGGHVGPIPQAQPIPCLFCPVKGAEDPADGQLSQELETIFP